MAVAAVFFADGFEEIEALSPVDYLRRAGVEVITVGVKGKLLGNSMVVTSSHKIPLITDTTFDNYIEEFGQNLPDCVICPGGSMGAENLGNTKPLLEHLEKAFAANKIVSAICASPAVVLGKTEILKGRKWTCYPEMEKEVTDSSCFDGHVNERVISDGNLITSRGAGTSEEFGMELVRRLAGEEKYSKIKAGTIQR